nr:unnamed protein product [Callosobruchus analis]
MKLKQCKLVVVITKEEFRCKNCIGVGQEHKETMDVKLLQKEVDCLSREKHLLEKYLYLPKRRIKCFNQYHTVHNTRGALTFVKSEGISEFFLIQNSLN